MLEGICVFSTNVFVLCSCVVEVNIANHGEIIKFSICVIGKLNLSLEKAGLPGWKVDDRFSISCNFALFIST